MQNAWLSFLRQYKIYTVHDKGHSPRIPGTDILEPLVLFSLLTTTARLPQEALTVALVAILNSEIFCIFFTATELENLLSLTFLRLCVLSNGFQLNNHLGSTILSQVHLLTHYYFESSSNLGATNYYLHFTSEETEAR